MARSSIIQRWVRGSLLIMVLVLVAAEAIFLYTSYRDLYGGVQRAIESRFSTIAGRLQATGTAGDSWKLPRAAARPCAAPWNSSTRRISLNSCCWTPGAWCSPPAAAP